MSDKLSKDYVYELVACCIKNKKVLDICATHLKYEYLQTDAQKKVVKYIFDTYALTTNAPSFGAIAQTFSTNQEIINFLAKVKQVKLTDDALVEGILNTFDVFIKDMKFQHLYHKIGKLYNDGKQDEAIETLGKESQEIVNFTVKAKKFVEVFSQFDERMDARERKGMSEQGTLSDRCTWGIHEFDQHTKGGPRKGTSFLAMAQSGIGKSTLLRWIALSNARMGKVVVLFQGESKEEEAMTTLDAAWTGITMEELEIGNVPTDLLPRIKKVRKEIQARGGKIYVVASEQFDRSTIEGCNDVLDDIEKIEGKIDMALWDYLEIYSSRGQWGKGESSERRRREDIAEKITNIAVQRNCVTGTATQSSDVKRELVDNPDFVQTRNHASEFKGIIKPFSYFFTLNATAEEYDAQQLRIYLDKIRKHPGNKVIKIMQARDVGRFYNSQETKKMFYDYNAVNVR